MRGSRAKVAGPAYRGTRVASTGPTLPDSETVCGRLVMAVFSWDLAVVVVGGWVAARATAWWMMARAAGSGEPRGQAVAVAVGSESVLRLWLTRRSHSRRM